MEETTTDGIKNPVVSSSLCLTKLLGLKSYSKVDKALMYASEWINHDGEVHSLSNNTKVLYTHLLNQYNYFTHLNKTYYQSQQTISDKLDLNLKTVKGGIKLLKEMGLLYIEEDGFRKYKMQVLPLKFLKGILYNKNITEAPEHKPYKNTYGESLIIQKNWNQVEKIKADLLNEYVTIRKEDFDQLLKRNQGN